MKKITILFLAVGTIFSFTQCNNNSGNIVSNADNRAKLISELMDSDVYMQEVMTAMKTKHSEVIVSTSYDMMNDNKLMATKMMGNMMEMCKSDTGMFKMMMSKTMEMCDNDKEKCKMMMGSMQEHPKGMKSMRDMGMCNMQGMNMGQKKVDNMHLN